VMSHKKSIFGVIGVCSSNHYQCQFLTDTLYSTTSFKRSDLYEGYLVINSSSVTYISILNGEYVGKRYNIMSEWHDENMVITERYSKIQNVSSVVKMLHCC